MTESLVSSIMRRQMGGRTLNAGHVSWHLCHGNSVAALTVAATWVASRTHFDDVANND